MNLQTRTRRVTPVAAVGTKAVERGARTAPERDTARSRGAAATNRVYATSRGSGRGRGPGVAAAARLESPLPRRHPRRKGHRGREGLIDSTSPEVSRHIISLPAAAETRRGERSATSRLGKTEEPPGKDPFARPTTARSARKQSRSRTDGCCHGDAGVAECPKARPAAPVVITDVHVRLCVFFALVTATE